MSQRRRLSLCRWCDPSSSQHFRRAAARHTARTNRKMYKRLFEQCFLLPWRGEWSITGSTSPIFPAGSESQQFSKMYCYPLSSWLRCPPHLRLRGEGRGCESPRRGWGPCGGYTVGGHRCPLAVRVALNTRAIRSGERGQNAFDSTDKHHNLPIFQWRLVFRWQRF